MQLLLLKEISVQLLYCKRKLQPTLDVFVGLEKDPQRQRRKGFNESLDRLKLTLKKNSVETCSNIVASSSLMI